MTTWHVLIITVSAAVVLHRPVFADNVDDAIRAMRERKSGYFLRPHHDACGELKALLRLRFSATKQICRAIDAARPDEQAFIAALYRSLGRIRDPSSITWLETKLDDDGTLSLLAQEWLPEWNYRCRSVANTSLHLNINWTDARERWFVFFVKFFRAQRCPKGRLLTLNTMADFYYDGEPAAQFFSTLEKDPNTKPMEMLIASGYLSERGLPYDRDRTSAAFFGLTGSDEGKAAMIGFTKRSRATFVIPWLIEQLPRGRQPELPSIVGLLRLVTMQWQLSTREDWEHWWATNKSGNIDDWRNTAIAQFERLLVDDHAKAVLMFESIPWVIPDLTSQMHSWMEDQTLRRGIARWLVASYAPRCRDEMKPIADRLVRESLADLDWYGRGGLAALDFVPGESLKWSDLFAR